MHLRITADYNADSGVGEVTGDLSAPTRRLFAPKDYGPGLSGIVVVLMCRNPELEFKRRIRFSKKEKKLYMDLMLNLAQMRSATPEDRKRIIVGRLAEEIPAILYKYSFKEFDEPRFVEDLRGWLKDKG